MKQGKATFRPINRHSSETVQNIAKVSDGKILLKSIWSKDTYSSAKKYLKYNTKYLLLN